MKVKSFITLMLCTVTGISSVYAKKAEPWDNQTYSKLAPLVLKAWSYPEHQKFYGVNKVPEKLQDCYFSKQAIEYGFRKNLESLDFLYSKYPQKGINEFIPLLEDEIADYYYVYSLTNFLNSRADDLSDDAKNEIKSTIDHIPPVDILKVGRTLGQNKIRPYRVLFSLGEGEIILPKAKRAFLDVEVINYCKANIGAGENA